MYCVLCALGLRVPTLKLNTFQVDLNPANNYVNSVGFQRICTETGREPNPALCFVRPHVRAGISDKTATCLNGHLYYTAICSNGHLYQTASNLNGRLYYTLVI